MNRHRLVSLLILVLAVFYSFFASAAQAYTSTDYYNAGLQLYNAQNYAQAVQYFSAAIQVDPNNAAALQGRANCYYAQGQYQQALDDYQRVQALSPNPQLASMIQALQAKVGTTSAAPPPQPGAPPPQPGTEDSFAQGTALFQQRQYAQAIPFFQKAAQDNPQNANAYYYLGACQMQTGDMKDAAVALGISNKLNPNASVGNYVAQIKSRLSPDDQQWVDGQITASANASAAGISAPANPKNFGIRFEPALVLPGMGDFNAEAKAGQAAAKAEQSLDPNLSYSASVPAGYPNIAFEPVYKVSPQFEVGLPIALGLVGSFTEASGSSSASGGVTDTITYNLSAFSIGFEARYIASLGKDMDLFVGGGPMIVPVSMNLTVTNTNANVNSTAMGFGGQLQVGMDYKLGDSFTVGPFAGYQFVSASGFTGTYQGTNYELYFATNPSSGQYPLITDGPPGSPPQGTRPLAVDLSGPFFGIGISAFF